MHHMDHTFCGLASLMGPTIVPAVSGCGPLLLKWHPCHAADHTKDSVKMEEFEIVRVKIENVNSDFSEEVGRPLDDGIVRIVKIEPTSLECMEIKEERSEEHITIPSTKDDAGLSDQESDSIQTSDILSCQEQVKSHSSELPYKCSVCGKGFYQSSHFHIHVLKTLLQHKTKGFKYTNGNTILSTQST
uniref:uncharacterized protein isoform X3 n=1 Tax=Myxine glutinosa TaxID=7769 RepID=UPI00358FA7F5